MAGPLISIAFKKLGQYANCPSNRGYCYAELAVSSLVVAVTIASTDFAYLQRDSQAELTSVAWLNTTMVYPRTVTHLSTNPEKPLVANGIHIYTSKTLIMITVCSIITSIQQ